MGVWSWEYGVGSRRTFTPTLASQAAYIKPLVGIEAESLDRSVVGTIYSANVAAGTISILTSSGDLVAVPVGAVNMPNFLSSLPVKPVHAVPKADHMPAAKVLIYADGACAIKCN